MRAKICQKVSMVMAIALLSSISFGGCGEKTPDESTLPVINQSEQVGVESEESSKSYIDQSNASDFSEEVSEESEAPVKKSTPEDFISLVKEGRYKDAISMYSEEFYGNAIIENQAAELFEKFIKEISSSTFDGSYEISTAKALMQTATNIIENIPDLEYYGINSDISDFDAAVHSKAAFFSGCELFDAGEWGGAIEQLKKVDERDSDSNAAKLKIDEAVSSAASEALKEAEEYVKSDDYISAILRLNECKNIIGENSQIDSKITVYTQKYISNTVKSADKAFGNSLDYEAAIGVIREAMQYYPEDKSLIDKMNYYNKFVPVELFASDPYQEDNNFASYDNGYDTFNVKHVNVIMSVFGDSDGVYDLGGNYNVFTCSVVGERDRDSTKLLEIYGDGKLLYRNPNVSTVSRSFDITLDVTGVKDLKFCLNTGYMLYNGYVKRTKK